MSYVFFEDVLDALGNKLTFEAVSNYAGNSFAKDAWKMIMEQFPLNKTDKQEAVMQKLVSSFRKGGIKIMTRDELNKKGVKVHGGQKGKTSGNSKGKME